MISSNRYTYRICFFHRALFRHHHTDLPIIFLRKVILIICLSMLISFTGDIVTLLFFRRPYFFHGSIVRRRKGLIRSFPHSARYTPFPTAARMAPDKPALYIPAPDVPALYKPAPEVSVRAPFLQPWLPAALPCISSCMLAASSFCRLYGIVFSTSMVFTWMSISCPFRPVGFFSGRLAARSILLRLFRYSLNPCLRII